MIRPCRKTGCLGSGHGGLCPSCARTQTERELRAAGWTDDQIRRAFAPNKADELLAILTADEPPLPPQGDA